MDSDTRAEWAKEFERVAEKIANLAYELTDNKDPREFIGEMDVHKNSLENVIASFKKAF